MRRVDPMLVVGVLGAVLITASPWLVTSYNLFLLTSAIITALAARSVGIVTGAAGQLSLATMSFAAVGGWVVSLGSQEGWPVPFPLLVVIGGLAAVPVGLLLGIPALRVRGINLAVVTLGFAAAVDTYLVRRSFPGAGQGIGIDPGDALLDPVNYFFFAWGYFLVVSIGVALLLRSRIGLAWRAVRSSERAAAAMGVRVRTAKLTAFVVSAFLAGSSGALLGGLNGLLSSENFRPVLSLVVFAVAVMMGAQFIEGALIAGALTVFFPELLRQLDLPQNIGDLLFAVGAIDALRRGRGGLAEQIRTGVRARRAKGQRTTADLTGPVPGDIPPPPADTGEPVLQVDDLVVRYGSVTALDGVSLTVHPHAVTALVGPNGAGKSTFVDVATGFAPRTAGSITMQGRDITRRSATDRARAGLRRTFQTDRTIPELTIAEYVRLAAHRRLSTTEMDELRGHLGLPDGSVPIGSLDIGTRRLVEIAGALASRPAVLLLDEPAAGLAQSESLVLAERIREMPARFGVGVLLIEHDMEHVQLAAGTVTVLDFGKLVATGPTAQVLADPRVVAAYLGEEVEVP